jgi:F0F1-type ATP synthase assembly protein I
MKMLALVSQLAFSMLTAILICGGIGYGIDAYFGTNTFVFFLILGVAGGYKACYNVICKFLGKKSLFDKEEK